jgi:TPR repeat protein
MKRILLIAGITAGCVLIAAGLVLFLSPAQSPVPTAAPSPAIDVAGLKAKAAQGDAAAQARLAKAFAEGDGVPRDYKQAARWCGQAASNGNIEAEAMLGELFQAGQGVHHDLTNAVRWFTKAAQQGSTTAQYDLAYMCERGQGLPHDEKLAAHWYQLAAEGGDALAQFDYGQRRLLGLGVTKDPAEGLKWLLLSAAQGQPDARAKVKSVQNDLTGEQIAEAKKRAAAFTPRAAGR